MRKIIFLITLFILPFFNNLYSQELNAEQVYSKVNKAVVTIYTFDSKGNPLSQGSGVIINEKGWVITNYHVYEGASNLIIKNNEKTIDYSKIICLDPVRDILILKISRKDFPQIKIGNSNAIRVGQKIYTVGSPLGLENTISDGIVSGIRSNDELSKYFIQISAAISPGSSGGAVIDSKGQLIGITTMTFSKGQNLNFAIPINDVLILYKNEEIKEREFQSAKLLSKAYREYRKDNFDLAIETFKKCIAINSNLADAYYFLGVIYMDYPDGKEIKVGTAIDYFEKAIKINPNYTKAYYHLGFIYSKINRIDLAISYHKKASQTNSAFLDSYYELAFIYIELEDYSKALASFEKIRQLDPNYNYSYYGNFYYGLGITYNRLKKYDSAIVSLNKAIALQDLNDTLDLSNYYSELAEAKYNKGNNSEAINNYKSSIRYNSENAKANFSLGSLYQKLGELDNAIIYFNRTIELEPENPLPYFNLSLIYEIKGDSKLQKYYRSKASSLDSRF